MAQEVKDQRVEHLERGVADGATMPARLVRAAVEVARIGERHTADTSRASVSLPRTCRYIVNASASLSGLKMPTWARIIELVLAQRRPCHVVAWWDQRPAGSYPTSASFPNALRCDKGQTCVSA